MGSHFTTIKKQRFQTPKNMTVTNFGCGLSNFNGAKLMIGFNLPLHLSTVICIAVAEVHKSWYRSYMSWECGLLLSGALFCFIGYLIAGIGLAKSNHKVLLASLGIVGMAILPYDSIFIPLTIYYLTLQIWSLCLIYGAEFEATANPIYPKDDPILLERN